MPMFRCSGAFVVYIVSGLFEYCGTINREKKIREKAKEHINPDKKNMTKYYKQEEQGHQKIVKVGREMREDERTKKQTRETEIEDEKENEVNEEKWQREKS